MYSFPAACPTCKRQLQIDLERPHRWGDRIVVTCDHCGVTKGVAAYQREYRRQQRHTARAARATEKVAQLTKRRVERNLREAQKAAKLPAPTPPPVTVTASPATLPAPQIIRPILRVRLKRLLPIHLPLQHPKLLGGTFVLAALCLVYTLRPRGEFPPLPTVKEILANAGYHPLAVIPETSIIRGRAAIQSSFARDAHRGVGVIEIFSDLQIPDRVIALSSNVLPYADLRRTHGLDRQYAFQSNDHRRRWTALVERLTGLHWPTDITLTKSDRADLGNLEHSAGYASGRGFTVEVLHWGIFESTSNEISMSTVVVLDQSFDW